MVEVNRRRRVTIGKIGFVKSILIFYVLVCLVSSQARLPFSNWESWGVTSKQAKPWTTDPEPPSLIWWTIMLLMSTETPLSLIVWFIWRSWGPCLKVQALVKVVLRSTSKFGRLEHWCIVHFDHIQRSHISEQCSSSTHFWSNHPQTIIGWLWSKRSIILLTKKSLQTPKKCYHKKKNVVSEKSVHQCILSKYHSSRNADTAVLFFQVVCANSLALSTQPPFFLQTYLIKWISEHPTSHQGYEISTWMVFTSVKRKEKLLHFYFL